MLQHYDSLHAAYLSSINIELAGEVERMMKTDARYTRKLNNSSFVTGRLYHFLRWRRNNTREIRKMSALILRYGYPGERLIGLPQALEDSAATAPLAVVNGIDWAAGNNLVLFMYLHYCSTRRSDISPMLFQFVSTGYLPAENYARICDYLARYGGKRAQDVRRYMISEKLDCPLSSININRNAIGLWSWDEAVVHSRLMLERRKNKLNDSTIILE